MRFDDNGEILVTSEEIYRSGCKHLRRAQEPATEVPVTPDEAAGVISGLVNSLVKYRFDTPEEIVNNDIVLESIGSIQSGALALRQALGTMEMPPRTSPTTA